MIETTTKISFEKEGATPKALSCAEMRTWALEKLSEITLRLGDPQVVIPIEAYIQTLEAHADVLEKRVQIAERTNEALFTKIVMSENK